MYVFAPNWSHAHIDNAKPSFSEVLQRGVDVLHLGVFFYTIEVYIYTKEVYIIHHQLGVKCTPCYLV